MTKEQVVKLLGEIKGIYGNKFELNEHTPNSWFKHLAELDFESVQKIIDRYAAHEKFPPTISDIKNPELYGTTPKEKEVQPYFGRDS